LEFLEVPSILSKHLNRFNFWSLEVLEQNLVLFYEFYNNERVYGSIGLYKPSGFLAIVETRYGSDEGR